MVLFQINICLCVPRNKSKNPAKIQGFSFNWRKRVGVEPTNDITAIQRL